MLSNINARLLGNPYLMHLFARPRLLGSVILGIATTTLLTPTQWHVSTRILLGWNIGTWLYILLVALMMSGATAASIERHAKLGDQSRFVILTLAILATIVCLGAILAHLGAAKDAQGYLKVLHIALAAVTIVSAWSFIHMIFTQHYAHEFFVERESEKELPEEARGGLRFPTTSRPLYSDFLYYSFVIGCASQTADVETTSAPMRVVTLIHGIISFFFNTTILALTINIASGLV